ncbi:MAG TPA: hypothetical protein VNF27_04710 [Candidatus Binataceae bacterium]|nr:hypothetical protein [Candidatus Binataceae bacterium]
MPPRRKKRPAKKRLIARLRKPMAPPARVEDDPKKYDRKRERERMRRQAELEKGDKE